MGQGFIACQGLCYNCEYSCCYLSVSGSETVVVQASVKENKKQNKKENGIKTLTLILLYTEPK